MKNPSSRQQLKRTSGIAVVGACLLAASLSAKAQETASSSECEMTERQQEMLSRVNEARSSARECGGESFPAVEPLGWSCQLEAAARRHSQDMAENAFFSHTGSEGSSIEERVNEQDYAWRAVGENIAAGHRSVEAAIEGWIESPGHCRNLMSEQFSEMGMARADNDDTRYSTYWTQTFADPR
ncbi:CAP domain-containing protein [Vreelandella sp. EE7]